ncbi:MAG: insulinase family protein, partial [Gemmatimonadota bacterium]|nr:insulinase family protein [Gemmatimonadota bacterium]
MSEVGAVAGGLRRTVLPNGLTVLSEQIPGVRSVAFGSWVRAASVHESRDRMGVSHLLEHMVFKGTERRSAKEIAVSLESLGGSLDAYTAREHTSFQARVLDEHLRQAADVIGDLVFRPLLRAEDLKLERKVVLEEISMVNDTPDDLVFELHNEEMWGVHPYGYSILGTRDTVSSLGIRDLRELHDRAYHPPQLVVAAAGNVDHDRL